MSNILLSGQTIEKMLGYAAEIAGQNHVSLDFTMTSIEGIDMILNLIHNEYASEESHNEENLSGISLSLGIYIGESIRKALKDSDILWWHGVPATGGQPTAFLKLNDNEIYPVDWVAKQIMNGKTDSIKKKFKLYTKKLVKAE